jgi:hypothetical protein
VSDCHSITAPTLKVGIHDANAPDLAASVSGAIETAVNDPLSVMSVSCQDPLLVRTYQGLPSLSYVQVLSCIMPRSFLIFLHC